MNQVKLSVEMRPDTGKGPAGRLRKQGRVPGVIYGYDVSPTPLSVDALELYHALHGPAGRNVLLVVESGEDTSLCVARDIQRHPVRGDYVHVDLLSVDKNETIVVDVPVHLTGEAAEAGVVSQILTTVPINVRPLDTPNFIELSIDGMEIGDVKRVEDLRELLPEGGSFDIEPERTIVTVNAPQMPDEDEDEDSDLLEVKTEGDAEGEGA